MRIKKCIHRRLEACSVLVLNNSLYGNPSKSNLVGALSKVNRVLELYNSPNNATHMGWRACQVISWTVFGIKEILFWSCDPFKAEKLQLQDRARLSADSHGF